MSGIRNPPEPTSRGRYDGELLSVIGGTPVNHTAFGREIRRLCRDMLTKFVTEADCGFQDGGCVTLATALREWSDGAIETYGIFAPGMRTVSHVIGRHADAFVDSDGIATEADMLAKFTIDHPYHSWRIRPYAAHQIGGNAFFPEHVPWIARRLRRRFGTFSPDLIDTTATATARTPPCPRRAANHA